jgi:hypothetical protein
VDKGLGLRYRTITDAMQSLQKAQRNQQGDWPEKFDNRPQMGANSTI